MNSLKKSTKKEREKREKNHSKKYLSLKKVNILSAF